MPIAVPNLDDRSFDELMRDARARIRERCPAWDLSEGDPGVILLELFAHLTEVMIYRLNRLPEKAYIEFLNLMGVSLQPPAAAAVDLRFRVSRPSAAASDTPRVEIPRGTRVMAARGGDTGEPVVFATAAPAAIAAGADHVEVRAYHVEMVEAELVGTGIVAPQLSVTVRRAPMVAPTGTGLDLIVGVEATAAELTDRAPAVQHGGRMFRVWTEVDTFANQPSDARVYVVDRASGTIMFAPSIVTFGALQPGRTLAATPAPGREIRVWYWAAGGGTAGNVAPDTLTTMKDVIPGVSVTNPQRAAGGRGMETLENALRRGPYEFHTLRRAVTAQDFELLAQRSSGAVARAKAFTSAELWRHAKPGTVEVVLVPAVTDREPGAGPLVARDLEQYHSTAALTRIQEVLDGCKPLGTTCIVHYASYKTVHVDARVVAHREEDPRALKARILDRLYRTISPLSPQWRFGQTLRDSHVFDILLAEPGVDYAESVRFAVDESPNRDVTCLVADVFQPRTWFAGSGDTLFRSSNDGDGWEAVGHFTGEVVDKVCVHPGKAGWVAIATRLAEDGERCRVHLSIDCGETWRQMSETGFRIEDVAWMPSETAPVLLAATSVGLYEFRPDGDGGPAQIQVDAAHADRGFYAVAVVTDVRGGVGVAVAARSMGGVFLSSDRGRSGTFQAIGLEGQDIRLLAVQREGSRTLLWAGLAASGGDPGTGCAMAELIDLKVSAAGWQTFSKGWTDSPRAPGGCWSLAFHGRTVLAGSHQAGLMRLDAGKPADGWIAPPIDCGLPHREVGRLFHRIEAVADSPDPDSNVVLCAGPVGISRSRDGGQTFEAVSSLEDATGRVTLPETWLFASGAHRIEVVSGDEAG